MVCGSCGQPSEKTGSGSVTVTSRSYRSSGGGIPEGLISHSYVVGNGTRRQVGGAIAF